MKYNKVLDLYGYILDIQSDFSLISLIYNTFDLQENIVNTLR